jgi:hypothetical protein
VAARTVSRYAIVSLSCPPLAGAVYLLGWIEGRRMVAADQGFEMAFYWSPLVFLAVDSALVVGAVVGLVGLGVGPGVWPRVQAASAALLCAGCILAVPWR